jgi:hypothetical protein
VTLCEQCQCVLDAAPTFGDKTSAMLRALGTGPKHLRDLAIAMYGRDTANYRRRAATLLKQHRPDVESVDGKGTWRMAQLRAEAAE